MESTIGGTRRHIVDVARGQLESGLDVHLCVSTLRDPGFPPDLIDLEQRGCEVTRLDMTRAIRPGKDARHLLELARTLERTRPDVVHTHSSKAGVLGRLASGMTGVGARVHTPHTFAFLFEAMFGSLKRDLFRRIERHLCGDTRAVVAVSPSEGHTFHSSGVVDLERIRVVENGIVPDPFVTAAPVNTSELGVPMGAPCAAVVGLLNAAKGQDIALRALAQPGCEDLHLLIAGDGEEREDDERLAQELGVADRAHFLGYRNDVPALLASVDFLLLPSRWEGMPYIVLEAMAAGLPVVATPVDGACDLVEDGLTGFLASAAHPERIAVAIEQLLGFDASERAGFGERARARLFDRYTRDRMIERMIEVYEEVR